MIIFTENVHFGFKNMVWRNSKLNKIVWRNDSKNDLAMVESQRHQPNFVSMDKIANTSYDQWKVTEFLFCLGNVWSMDTYTESTQIWFRNI